MPETATTQLARGMRDVLPEETARVRRVESAFAATCRAWGYGEIRTPVIEPLHLFTAAARAFAADARPRVLLPGLGWLER